MTVHIELDRAEPGPPPPPPRRRWVAVVVGAAVLAVAGTALVVRDEAPPGPLEVSAAWTATVPDELGRALAARVVGGAVLVVAERGMVAYLRGGGELWRRALDVDLTAGNAWQQVRLADGVAVIETAQGFQVTDLATGVDRFTIAASGEAAVVLADRIVVFDCGETCAVAATDLTTGAELWHDKRDALPLLPEVVSARHQTVALANPAPLVPEPESSFFVWQGRAHTTVDLATGGELGTWTPDGEPELRIFGRHLVDVGTPNVVGYLDPFTGRELWSRATLSELGRSGPVTLVDGYFLDSAPPDNRSSPGYYQLIDPATGDIPSTPTAAGRRIIAVRTDLAVGIDPITAELVAVRPRDSSYWHASLRKDGSYGFTTTGFLVGDGWLAVGDDRGGLWYVELSTGSTGNVPGSEVIGLDAGALISADAARRTVELRELGVR